MVYYRSSVQKNMQDYSFKTPLVDALLIIKDNEDIFHGEIREHKQKDPFCMAISNYLKFAKGMPPDVARIVIKEIDNFVIDEDLDFLCHVTIPSQRYKSSDVRILPIVPQSLIKSILDIYHDSSIGGHFGFLKTYIRIRERFYFRNMYAIIKKYVQSCLVCCQRKGLNYAPKSPLGSLPEVSRPLELVGIDLLGPLPESHVTLVALPNKTANYVTKAFVEKFMLIYGPCENLVSDQGKEFCLGILKQSISIGSEERLMWDDYLGPEYPDSSPLTDSHALEPKQLFVTVKCSSPVAKAEIVHALNEVKLGLGHLIVPYEGLLEVTSSTWTIAGEFSFDFSKEISVTTRKYIGHLQRYEAERLQPNIPKNVSNTQQLASYKLKENFAIRYGYENQEILSHTLSIFLKSKLKTRTFP
ncbi:hypothetical protein QYM36_014821 [Artemia franciscana]|uniref:Integrase zinc-binding domain-containing protein n=1 Tax=Artemia franciscana TaxID=6661 RepID=A0AA88HK98_ARTSF|nr:hypothetical protein QYM36_014821 [Artemia franciscana]